MIWFDLVHPLNNHRTVHDCLHPQLSTDPHLGKKVKDHEKKQKKYHQGSGSVGKRNHNKKKYCLYIKHNMGSQSGINEDSRSTTKSRITRSSDYGHDPGIPGPGKYLSSNTFTTTCIQPTKLHCPNNKRIFGG